MKSILKKIVKKKFENFPWRNYHIYKLCKRYVDAFNGDNNGDLFSNGEVYLVSRYIGKSNVVFDVGANIGEWAKIALSLNSKIQLHCFEPSQRTFSSLLEQQFPTNVVLNNFGLGSASSEKTLFIFDDNSPFNSLWKRNNLESYGLKTPRREEKVKLETIDNYCSINNVECIDILKVDVEGHELEVIRGARKLIEEGRINLIQFEYGGTYVDSRTLLKDIFEVFTNLNYSFYKLYPKQVCLVKRYDACLENFQYQNWAIIRNGWE